MKRLFCTVVFMAVLHATSSASKWDQCKDWLTKASCDYYSKRGSCKTDDYIKKRCKLTCNLCVTTATPTTSQGICKDVLSLGTCRYYKKYKRCETDPYVKEKCKDTCGLCSGVQTTSLPVTTKSTSATKTSGTCKDLIHRSTCDYYKRRGHCITNPNIRKKCKRTCNLCGVIDKTTTISVTGTTKAPVETTTSSVCEDVKEPRYCDYYKRYGMCKTNSNMKKHCRLTCGYCTPPTPVTDGFTGTYPTPAQGSCGISLVPGPRVIAGQKSKQGQWPWQIAMYKNGRFSCGGSLIHPMWVVTAAHCISKVRVASTVEVVLGELHRSYPSGHEQKIRISKIIQHGNYGRSTKLNYDIALLKLSKPAKYNYHVQPVCMPKHQEHVPVGTKCYITGWGKTRHPGRTVNELQHTSLNVISKTECTRTNKKYAPITDQMVCAKNKSPARQSGCHGDSGGPFVCQGKDGRWSLHGAVSWGSPKCDIFDASTVFARISEMRNWIDDKMKSN